MDQLQNKNTNGKDQLETRRAAREEGAVLTVIHGDWRQQQTHLGGGNRLPSVWKPMVSPGEGELTLLLVETV